MDNEPETVMSAPSDRQTEEALWEISDVMDYLKVSDPTVRRRVAEGMPCVRIGGVLRFIPERVRQWVREQAVA